MFHLTLSYNLLLILTWSIVGMIFSCCQLNCSNDHPFSDFCSPPSPLHTPVKVSPPPRPPCSCLWTIYDPLRPLFQSLFPLNHENRPPYMNLHNFHERWNMGSSLPYLWSCVGLCHGPRGFWYHPPSSFRNVPHTWLSPLLHTSFYLCLGCVKWKRPIVKTACFSRTLVNSKEKRYELKFTCTLIHQKLWHSCSMEKCLGKVHPHPWIMWDQESPTTWIKSADPEMKDSSHL